ncbi:hypothetical protein [Nostoc flagelliforme]|uniref:hypothetical protein n=1 Tax=Nostoc flagelliforme TaxID=1306274 RepID=UPI0016843599|nr:hypothetical protein [Nostoc flagelliforme]
MLSGVPGNSTSCFRPVRVKSDHPDWFPTVTLELGKRVSWLISLSPIEQTFWGKHPQTPVSRRNAHQLFADFVERQII